jgi:hypothetical protein
LSLVRETISIEKLSKLLDSDTPITMESDIVLHSWAKNPKTIGTLAVIQLGIFASDKEVLKKSSFVQSIVRYNVLDKLMLFINSEERDKFEAGMLTLSFLTENNEDILKILINKNIIGTLVKFMADKKEGLKSTAALCCRNLYIARPPVQKVFISEGGTELLINLLDSDDSTTVFETILNILDLLLDSDDTIQPDIKKKLVSLGIKYQLQRIISETSRYDSETINEAQKLSQLFD